MYFFHCTWTILINVKKKFWLPYFKSKRESVFKVFEDMKILTVHELYDYELIKFKCKSLNSPSTTAFHGNFYELNSGQQFTWSSRLLTFTISSERSTFHSFSLKHRGSQFLNFLNEKDLFPKSFGSLKDGEVTDFVYTFRDFRILSNIDLVKLVFESQECDDLGGWCLSLIAARTAWGQKLIDVFLAQCIVVVGGLLISS